MKEKNELPKRLQMDNMFMAIGVIGNIALLPIFIFNSTKTMRHGRGLNMPKAITIYNPLSGYSCAMITDIACWQYGVPTHMFSLQWEMRDDAVGLNYTFMVPKSQHFYADMILRQWGRKIGFTVDSNPVLNEYGIPSTHYQDRDYEPQGVKALNKSVDMMLGHLLFSSVLVSSVSIKKEKVTTKKDSGKGAIKHVPIRQSKEDDLKFVPEKKKSKTQIEKTKSLGKQNTKPKMGKTYS